MPLKQKSYYNLLMHAFLHWLTCVHISDHFSYFTISFNVHVKSSMIKTIKLSVNYDMLSLLKALQGKYPCNIIYIFWMFISVVGGTSRNSRITQRKGKLLFPSYCERNHRNYENIQIIAIIKRRPKNCDRNRSISLKFVYFSFILGW